MNETVVALFDDFATSQQVVEDLVDAGFSRDDISLVANDAAGAWPRRDRGAHSLRRRHSGAGHGHDGAACQGAGMEGEADTSAGARALRAAQGGRRGKATPMAWRQLTGPEPMPHSPSI